MKEIYPEPRWKSIARNIFFLLAILSVIPLALAGFFTVRSHQAGTKERTAEKTVESVQHADKKYISLAESERIRLMWTIFLIGFPSVILLGFLLRFGFRVNILKQEPLPPWTERLMSNLRKENQ